MKKYPVSIVACILWIVFGSAPIVFSSPPLPTFDFFGVHPACQLLGKVLLVGLLATLTGFIWRLDPEPVKTKVVRYFGFALVAALLADHHYHTVDLYHMDWQIRQFGGILMHTWPPPRFR